MTPPGWQEVDDALVRSFKFDNFLQAFGFMTQVALLAESAGHHPDWRNVYNTVEIRLNTHDAGSTVTQKDRDLALAINAL